MTKMYNEIIEEIIPLVLRILCPLKCTLIQLSTISFGPKDFTLEAIIFTFRSMSIEGLISKLIQN